ncbi:hypothetical protein [uncultured Paracoccus sp.]|uniref:hypothetical protein n=1 Tax=uncultured Paracoccus sp. TaxID=189685 RepID=UPI00260149A2|nr:hypothetical protein [uncultured Paracoccus sp.]
MSYDNDTGATGATSVTAMFDNRDDAQRAVDRLAQAGISAGRIRLVSGGGDNPTPRHGEDKGFWERLGDFFFPDEDRYAYAEGLSRGGYLVTATDLAAAEHDMALDILDDDGSIDMDQRAENWRSEGWGGYEGSGYAVSAGAGSLVGGTLVGARADDLDAHNEYGAHSDQRGIRAADGIITQDRPRPGTRDSSHGRTRVRAYRADDAVGNSASDVGVQDNRDSTGAIRRGTGRDL